MSPRRLQQIAAGETVKALLASEAPDLAPVIQSMPEGQARVMATIAPEKRIEVLRTAVSTSGKMTAAKIKQAKARVVGTEPNLPMHTPVIPELARRAYLEGFLAGADNEPLEPPEKDPHWISMRDRTLKELMSQQL